MKFIFDYPACHYRKIKLESIYINKSNFEDDRLIDCALSDLELIKNCYEEMYAHTPIFFLDGNGNTGQFVKGNYADAITPFHVYVASIDNISPFCLR